MVDNCANILSFFALFGFHLLLFGVLWAKLYNPQTQHLDSVYGMENCLWYVYAWLIKKLKKYLEVYVDKYS